MCIVKSVVICKMCGDQMTGYLRQISPLHTMLVPYQRQQLPVVQMYCEGHRHLQAILRRNDLISETKVSYTHHAVEVSSARVRTLNRVSEILA